MSFGFKILKVFQKWAQILAINPSVGQKHMFVFVCVSWCEMASICFNPQGKPRERPMDSQQADCGASISGCELLHCHNTT